MTQPVNEKRIRTLSSNPPGSGPVVYWMSRDQRVKDNWALIFAQELALGIKVPLKVIFCLVPSFLEAAERQYGFMLKGLAEAEGMLQKLDISFHLLTGNPEIEIDRFCREQQAAALVSDFSPLKINRQWKETLVKKMPITFYEIDAHNIIPCWITSPKQEYAAYTIRSKIKKLLPEYLKDIPRIERHPFPPVKPAATTDWREASESLKIDRSVKEVKQFKPGEKAAWEAMRHFIENKLARYDADRSNPNLDAQSGLSPYLHFGHLSAQRLALMVKGAEEPGVQPESYLEELIIRRELSDNFCFYNDHYDTVKAFPRWARESLDEHSKDPREYVYSPEEFEKAKTHDPLWNAAQMEMVSQGKMHGYMRMYWAKKILEWTNLPEEAIKIAIYLNDKYSLDGRDPNGYAGIAWSIGGVHDRAWKERPIFGKVRYMNYKGTKRKFDVDEYIANNS